MHRHCRPRHSPMPPHLQIFSCAQRHARRAIQEFFLYAFVVFLPAMIGKRSKVVENQPVFLRIKLRGTIRISRAPCGAILVDQFAKSGFIRGFLLRTSSDKCQQSTRERQRNIKNPAPPFATSGVSIFYSQDHLRSPREFFGIQGEESTSVAHTLWRIVYNLQEGSSTCLSLCTPSSLSSPASLFADSSRHWPVIPPFWPKSKCAPSLHHLVSLVGGQIARM